MKRGLEVEEEVKDTLKNIVENRRFLYNIGEYELEDGEIIG